MGLMTVRQAYDLYSRDTMLDTHAHLPFYRECARGNVLEIGVHTGISTTALLLGVEEKGGHLWSVDCHPQCRYAWHGHPQWTFVHAHSIVDSAKVYSAINMPLDLLYVDGGHEYETCLWDLDNYSGVVKKGGMILVHDVELEKWCPGVRKAFEETVALHNWRHEIRHGSCGLGVIYVE